MWAKFASETSVSQGAKSGTLAIGSHSASIAVPTALPVPKLTTFERSPSSQLLPQRGHQGFLAALAEQTAVNGSWA